MMQEFEKISIAEIPKKDMLLILEALQYTGENKNLEEYLSLKNSIVSELSELADSSEEEFIDYLKK
jgi:tagatose-1,6-bisphosphate aldolase